VNPIEFQRKWIGVELKERSASQEHFLDLCRVLDHPTPADLDPAGEFFTFERGASKAMGGHGWADVWYRDHFAWEYKGRRANLKAAYDQLNLYRESLENPPLLIVSDLNRIEIHTNFTGTVKDVHTIDLGTFAEPANLNILRRVFTDPDSLKPGRTRASVTQDAARQFSRIAIGMHERGVNPHTAAHYLVQLLFCLFAEDVGLLPNAVFSKMVAAGVRNPLHFNGNATELLTTMNTGGTVAYEVIPRFNGGLFQTVDVPSITVDDIRVLHTAAGLDWSSIEPSIFGTLFERSLDPNKRSQLGAHYTGRHDIERVVDPVVMTPLRRRWDAVRAEADELKRLWGEAKTPQTRTNRRAAFAQKIGGFLDELAAVRILDPACGSGNFLYVALERLLTLEKEVMTYRANNGLPMGLPLIRPTQVLGLEINEYAQELAQVAVWIGYLQWMITNGFTGISEPVLDPLETITLRDALLNHADGTVTETVWPKADFIIGNPPFLGRQFQRRELGDEYTETLRRVYADRLQRGCDLVCYFFEQGRAQIEQGNATRAGLLANTTIQQVDNREVLRRIKDSGDIFMAWRNLPWVLDGASVRIAVIGFDDGAESVKVVDGQPVQTIESDLSPTGVAFNPRQLPENSGISFQGPIKVGPFDIDGNLARELLSLPTNVNGRSNSDVVKRYVNGADIVGRPRNIWIIDFGVGLSAEDASLYEAPFEHVRKTVKPERNKQRHEGRRENWWIHGSPAGRMRKAVTGLSRFVVTPAVAKHRIFAWLDSDFYPDHRLCVFAREDDYFFGVLHSRAHEVWSMRTVSRHGIGNDPTYNNTTCFETFPLPWPPGTEPVNDPRVIAIGDAAAKLDSLRRNWLDPEGATEAELKKRTLTNLYNLRPTWLQNAHRALDRAVWAAYGWEDSDPATMADDTILSRLLCLNRERVGS